MSEQAAAPRGRAPAVRRRDSVLVTGPRLAGVSTVAAALRNRLPGRVFVEATELVAGEAPSAVVFVVSAAAVLTVSDCALLDAAAAHTDAVIGAVTKIDVHRHWPQMLAAARDGLCAHAPRYRGVRWVAVAAAPHLSAPRLDDLIAEVQRCLADPTVARRNQLRSREAVLQAAARGYHRADSAAAALQQQRDSILRQHRRAKSERTLALRRRIAQARVQLSYFARNRCAAVRAELTEDAAGRTRRRLAHFEAEARGRVDAVITDVADGVAAHLADVAHQLGLPVAPPATAAAPRVEVAQPALPARRLETQLTMLVGAGFGLGLALTLSRLFADLTAGLTAAGAAACAGVGLVVTVWVVRTRALLHDRVVLDRWVIDLVAAVRSAAEELVALQVLSAESTLTAMVAEHHEAEAARVAGQVAALDHDIREHTAAAALRDRRLPALNRALTSVRAELAKLGNHTGNANVG